MGPFVFFILVFGTVFCSFLWAAPAGVYVPTEPTPEEMKAAEELAHYWEKMTGHSVMVLPEGEAAHPITPTKQERPRYHRFGGWRSLSHQEDAALSFHVGETVAARSHAPLPADLDIHGFVLRSVGKQLFLRGGSPIGTRFAVYRFLHLHGGVRWYMPTELGEHVPAWKGNGLPRIQITEEPDFLSRQWYDANRFSGDDWEGRNLLAGRYRFHHNVHAIFTEAVYDVRPDFFILLGGERIRPDDALGGNNFQICFGNPDAATFAARKAAEFFDANPEEISYSLAMTDTAAICQCPDCHQWIDPEKTFRKLPDYSDLIFTFMNRAAEELSKTHPEKYLGALAYHWAENVPSFPVHPKVLPYLTADRPQWQDPDFRREDKELMQRWSKAGPERLGLWDYYFGQQFVIPRQFSQVICDSLRHARDAGINGFFGQLSSNWALDGPKAWLGSQLLWDADQNHEELLDEFYKNFFAEAGEPMREFYDRCEAIWMNQGEPVYWLKFYHDLSQLELFSPAVCASLREHLAEAGRLAASDLVRERVKLVSEGFRRTEMYSELYHGVKEAAAEADHLDRDELVERLEEMVTLRISLENHHNRVLAPKTLHRSSVRIEQKAVFLPGMKLDHLIARTAALSNGGDEHDELVRLVERLSDVFPESQALLAVTIAEAREGGDSSDIIWNGSFRLDELLAEANDEDFFSGTYVPLGWERQPGEVGAVGMVLSDKSAAEGNWSFSGRGVIKEALHRGFGTKPGELYLLQAEAKGRVSAGSRVEIQLTWLEENGGEINRPFRDIDPLLPGEHPDWTQLNVYAEAPPGASFGRVSLRVHHQAQEDFIYFDKVRLHQVQCGETGEL